MMQREVMKRLVRAHQSIFSIRNSSNKLNIEKLEEESSSVEVIDDEAKIREEEIEKKRNKSRLRDHHRNILYNKNSYSEPLLPHQETLRFKRRTYGKYGQESGIDPALCWPVKDELDEALEYERVKHPFTIPEMVAAAKQKRQEKEERVLARQADIVKKMEKLEEWKQDLYNRIAKKENEAKAAKERKERLIEEVKRHFGYTVDPRDERFKEMLEKKEKEQKKAMKEARRQEKEAKMVNKLLKKKSKEKKSEDVVEESEKQ